MKVIRNQPGSQVAGVVAEAAGDLTEVNESFNKAAEARLLVEEEKHTRERRAGVEIDGAVQAILKKYKCTAKFMELREGGQTTRIWIQPVALDE